MTHRPQVVAVNAWEWRCICNCKTGSPHFPSRQLAEDWQFKHLRLADQAMVHLRSRNPSIKDQFDYYTTMARDSRESAENRRLWQQLADGLHSRLPPPSTPPPSDDPLPFEVPYTPRRNRSRDRP